MDSSSRRGFPGRSWTQRSPREAGLSWFSLPGFPGPAVSGHVAWFKEPCFLIRGFRASGHPVKLGLCTQGWDGPEAEGV